MPKNRSGFTLIELILVVGMLFVLLIVVIVTVDPSKRTIKAQDVKRLDNLLQLSAAIEEYRLDNGYYPGDENVTYNSVDSINGVWIEEDLTEYIPVQLIDPVNDDTYNFRYQRVGNGYELDVNLGVLTEDELDDSGNNNQRYEVGTNLQILD